MKAMDLRPGQGANRIDSRSYREDLQRRHGCEGALSCFDISVLLYQGGAQAKLLTREKAHNRAGAYQ